MLSQLVPLSFEKIMQTKAYTMVILAAEEKKFAIYVDSSIGKMMQMYLTETDRARPLTHDLINMSFEGFGIKLKHIVLVDIQDTIYYARIFYEQEVGGITHIVEVDARPSDGLTLALINGVPVYCTEEVLEESVAVED
jgi:bifunctional DNase/RNase